MPFKCARPSVRSNAFIVLHVVNIDLNTEARDVNVYFKINMNCALLNFLNMDKNTCEGSRTVLMDGC